MSESAVSALNRATFTGIARVEECGLQGMITVRADLSASAVKKAAAAAAGCAMPARLAITTSDDGALAWMSPDEALLMCPYAEVDARIAKLTKALAKTHALVVDVSDARAVFRVSGVSAREVLAKLCPVDFAPEAFAPGLFRRTRMAQIPAAVWIEDDAAFRIICFRSVAQYVFDLLKVAAANGSGVGYFDDRM